MRKTVTINPRILLDSRFTGLDIPGQQLWFELQIHPKTNILGVCDWMPKRLRAYVRGMSVETLDYAGRELSDAGFIIIDDDTDEVLLLNHFDRLEDVEAVEEAYVETASPRLRGVLVHELRNLKESGVDSDFDWAGLSDLLAQPSIDPESLDKPEFAMLPFTLNGENSGQAERAKPTVAGDKPNQESQTEPAKRRRGRPPKKRAEDFEPVGKPVEELKPKSRRGRPKKDAQQTMEHVPTPVELTDGTMEPPSGEPMSMAQVEIMPQFDVDAPIDVDAETGEPRYVKWEDVPEELWFYHPLPEDWTPSKEARQLCEQLGAKKSIEDVAKTFRNLYEQQLYIDRPNGHKAAWMTPERLFIQQLLHWRKEKDEENAAKQRAQEAEAGLEEGETVEPEILDGDISEADEPDVLIPDDEAPAVRHYKRMVPKDWKPNQHHYDKARELGVDVNMEAERFYAYSHANGKKYLDFDMAFNNWLLNAVKFGQNNGNGQRRKTKSEEGLEHNMRMLNDALTEAGWKK